MENDTTMAGRRPDDDDEVDDELILDGQIDRFAQYLAQRPDSPSVYYNLGCALAKKGDIENAGRAFLKALTLNPKMPQALINLGGLCFSAGDFEQALDYNKQALDQEPKSVFAMLNIGLAQVMLGRFDEGVETLYEVLRLDRNNGRAHYLLAVTYLERGDILLCRKHYDIACSLKFSPDPGFVEKLAEKSGLKSGADDNPQA